MTRRLLIFLPLAALLRADSEKDVENVLTVAASGLSAGRPEVFLDPFDRSMPDYEKLHAEVIALANSAEVSCSIEVVSSEGDDQARTLKLDWTLVLATKDEHPTSSQREKTVTCKFQKIGKKWRIVGFEPLDLFAPQGA